MAEVERGAAVNKVDSRPQPGSNVPGERFDPSAEQSLIDAEMVAWRVAIAHQKQGSMGDDEWKAVRKKDEAEAMKQLEALANEHPRTSFIKTMMGQVKHHFGKEKEAADYYEEALAQNRHDPLMTFKIAEARRASGNQRKAIDFYRETLDHKPDFTEAKLGLAHALLEHDKSDTEAQQIVAAVLQQDPSNTDALKLQKLAAK